MKISATIILLVLIPLFVNAQEESIFIPASTLTLEEVNETKEQLKESSSLSEEEIDEIFGNGLGFITYRESDIRSAFNTLQENDKRLSICSNSIMEGAAQIVFASEVIPELNQAILKTASCIENEEGLVCKAMEEEWKYAYNDIYFDITSGNYEKAIEIISVFAGQGIEDLPERLASFDVQSITKIQQTFEGYLIHVGNVYCGGCVAKILVKPSLSENSEIQGLTFVDAIDTICI